MRKVKIHSVEELMRIPEGRWVEVEWVDNPGEKKAGRIKKERIR